MKISRMSPDNNLETVTNEDDKEMPKEWCISPGDDLMIWWFEVNMILKWWKNSQFVRY